MKQRAWSLWLHFLRFWHVIDLTAAQQVGNWELITDCRLRVAEIDRALDRLRVATGGSA